MNINRREFIANMAGAAGLAAAGGCASLTDGGWRLKAVRYSDSKLGEDWILPGGDKKKDMPTSLTMYYIEEGDRRILVDPGCDTLPGFFTANFVKPVDALAREGITPADITDIVVSHAHHDHIDCVRYFPDAVVHIQRGEARDGKGYLKNSKDVRVFDEETVLTPHITVKRCGGHTPGHALVLLSGRPQTYVICGDACYARINLEKRIRTATCPKSEQDAAQRFVDTYSAPTYRTFLCHDPLIQTGWL